MTDNYLNSNLNSFLLLLNNLSTCISNPINQYTERISLGENNEVIYRIVGSQLKHTAPSGGKAMNYRSGATSSEESMSTIKLTIIRSKI